MKPTELKKGHVYFGCGWLTGQYPIPAIKTIVYLGKNLCNDSSVSEQDEYYFEDASWYFRKDIQLELPESERELYQEPEEPPKIVVPEDSLDIVKNIDGLIDLLERSKKEPGATDVL